MPIQKELWSDTLIKNYWKNNAFAAKAVKVGKEFIYGGKIVHLPAVDTKPTVTRNLNVFPAAVVERTDGDVIYAIDGYYVAPFRIPNAEKYELSYDKRISIITDQSAAANQAAAEWLAYHWAKYTQTTTEGTTTIEAQQLRTTGAAVLSHLPSATGNRKMLTVADFGAAKVLLNKADVPGTDRYALVDSDMLDQLTQDDEYKKAEKVYEQELIEGSVAKIKGFNIFERSSALRYDNAGTPAIVAPGAAGAAAHNGGALLWHTNGVENAIGETEFFEEVGSPTHYGDIYSALLRAGGRIRRADSVVAIIQAASA